MILSARSACRSVPLGCSAGMRGLYETTVCKAHAAALKSGERDIYNSVENMIYRYRTPRLRTSVEGLAQRLS